MTGEIAVYRTASLKLHNLSRRKRDIIEHAFTEYTLSYRALLEWAKENQSLLEVECKKETADGKQVWSERKLANVLSKADVRKPDVHNSLCESLYADVAASLLSYYALREEDERTSFPVSRDPRSGAFGDALDQVACTLDVDEEEWRYRQSQLTRLQRGRYMPMFFARPDGVPQSRNFALLADDEHDRYYALLFLLPRGHSMGRPIEAKGNLRRIGYPKGSDPAEFKPPYMTGTQVKSAILCPLEMGRWHVDEFLKHPNANVRTAFLVEREGEYFLNVAFEFTVPAVKTEAVIGIDRGVAQLMALAVLDLEGNLRHEEKWSGSDFLAYQWDMKKELRRRQKRGKSVSGMIKVRRVSDHTTHAIANRIVELAVEYRAQVVVENLKRFDRRKEKFYQLRATPYQSIVQKLDYKLRLHGLPPPAPVSPAYTSKMCSNCRFASEQNRLSQANFECERCGYTHHADLNAAINIARRWLARQRKDDWWPDNISKKSKEDEVAK